MQPKTLPLTGFPQGPKKRSAILVIPRNRFPPVPARHHMIYRFRKLDPHLSWPLPLLSILIENTFKND